MMHINEMPVYVRKALSGAAGHGRVYINNEKASEFLMKTFGLFTDNNETNIEGFGQIDFDWIAQKWYVK